MKSGLLELNKENVMGILDKHVEILEDMGREFEERATTDSDKSINHIWQVMFALLCVKSIRADMRELLYVDHFMCTKNDIIELLDEVNARYNSKLKLETKNIITASEVVDLYKDLSRLDAIPGYEEYVFDVEDIIPILKKKMEMEK